MYYELSGHLVGYCQDIDFQQNLYTKRVLVSEDLKDALPYLYEKHFGVPYDELSWWFEKGAKEWVKEIEDKWFHNQLDLSELYKDKDFLSDLSSEYMDSDNLDIDDLKDDFEDSLRYELEMLSNEELKELYEYSSSVDYDILDDDDNVIEFGSVDLPELEEEEEDY